jgi:ATP-dependent RNA helicase DDX31/DBP7
MDLEFEDKIQKIVQKLDEAQRRGDIVGLPPKRTTILCSATMKMNVQRLGEISLKEAALIKADDDVHSNRTGPCPVSKLATSFYAPAQLRQSYTVVAAKLRLVALSALLKRTFARKGSVMKAIVFLSCADSVDFHYDVFTRPLSPEACDPSNLTISTTSTASNTKEDLPYGACPTLFPHSSSANPTPLTIYKLHGSLPQTTRTSILRLFSTSSEPSILLATDVASRGLDLPNLDLVIEYDPAFSSDDHLHRIGRTARLGRDGRAIIFLQPGSEGGYVDILRSAYQPPGPSDGICGHQVTHTLCDEILKRGFEASAGVVSRSDSTSRAGCSAVHVTRWRPNERSRATSEPTPPTWPPSGDGLTLRRCI